MADTSSITTYSPSSSDDDESDTSTLHPSQTPAPSYPPSLLPAYTPNYKGTYATKEDYLTALRAWAKEKEYMKPSEGFGNLQGFYGDMNSEDYIKRAEDRRRIGRGTQGSISNKEDVAGSGSAGVENGRRKSRTLFSRRRTSRAEGESSNGQASVDLDADSVAELNVAPDKGTQTTNADRPVSTEASETSNGGRRPSWFKRRWNDYKGMVDEEEKMPESDRLRMQS